MYAKYVKNLIYKDVSVSVTAVEGKPITRIVTSVDIGDMPIETRYLIHDSDLYLCGNPEEMLSAKVKAMKQDLVEFVMQRLAWEFGGDEYDGC